MSYDRNGGTGGAQGARSPQILPGKEAKPSEDLVSDLQTFQHPA